jgi:hypothetical protein
LKLQYDEPPSNCAFKFNLRRYSTKRAQSLQRLTSHHRVLLTGTPLQNNLQAGAFTRPLFSSTQAVFMDSRHPLFRMTLALFVGYVQRPHRQNHLRLS